MGRSLVTTGRMVMMRSIGYISEMKETKKKMALSPSKKNSGLVNPRWRMCINFLKKDLIDS